jgi:hypothetical protein
VTYSISQLSFGVKGNERKGENHSPPGSAAILNWENRAKLRRTYWPTFATLSSEYLHVTLPGHIPLPKSTTTEGPKECENCVILKAAKLEQEESLSNFIGLLKEWKTVRQCKDICSKAEKYLMVNKIAIEECATIDVIQPMVSTSRTIVGGVNQEPPPEVWQITGYLSHTSI